jgi:hypothetical protein
VSVLLNDGKGTFATRVDYSTGLGPSAIAALDVNGDGRPELATSNQLDDTITVLLNDCP